MNHKPRKAKVIREDDTAKYVKDETGEIHNLVKGSMNSTQAPVGTKGTIQYVSCSSYGLYFFSWVRP